MAQAVSTSTTADALTGLRAATAVLLTVSLATSHRGLAAALLAISWVSDAADGRAARRDGRPGRLAEHDLTVDVAVGLAIALGGALGRRWGWWVAGVGVLLAVAWLGTANAAWAMASQAVGYGMFLRDLATDRVAGWWLPFATIAVLAVAERRRLTDAILPSFLAGVRHPFRPRPIPDRPGAQGGR